MQKQKSRRIHAFLIGNVVMSLLVFVVTVYFIIVGEYSNIQERNATEAVLNLISLSSLAYGTISLIAALLTKPFLYSVEQK